MSKTVRFNPVSTAARVTKKAVVMAVQNKKDAREFKNRVWDELTVPYKTRTAA